MSAADVTPVRLQVDGRGVGSISVAGHDMSSAVMGVSIEVSAGGGTEVTLHMRPDTMEAVVKGRVSVGAATAGALLELGWTPPAVRR